MTGRAKWLVAVTTFLLLVLAGTVFYILTPAQNQDLSALEVGPGSTCVDAITGQINPFCTPTGGGAPPPGFTATPTPNLTATARASVTPPHGTATPPHGTVTPGSTITATVTKTATVIQTATATRTATVSPTPGEKVAGIKLDANSFLLVNSVAKLRPKATPLKNIPIDFTCDASPNKRIQRLTDFKGIAAVKESEAKKIGCDIEAMKADMRVEYLDPFDGLPRKQSKMYPYFFADFNLSGTPFPDTLVPVVAAPVYTPPNDPQEVLGIRPAVEGRVTDKQTGDPIGTSQVICFFYDDPGPDVKPCNILGVSRQTRTDNNSDYIFTVAANGTPGSGGLSYGDYYRHKKTDTTNLDRAIYVKVRKNDKKWFDDHDVLSRAPELLYGTKGEGLAGVGNRYNCTVPCNDKSEEINQVAHEYASGQRTFHFPGDSACASFVTTVLKDVDIFTRLVPSCFDLNSKLVLAAQNQVIKQVFPPNPIRWQKFNYSGFHSRRSPENALLDKLVPGDVIVFSKFTHYVKRGQHAVLYAGKDKYGNHMIIHTTGRGRRQRVALTSITQARSRSGNYHYWSAFSFRCWDGTPLPLP